MPKLSAGKMADRRDHIMSAALRCFDNRGFAASTVDDVCGEAKISKGAFYTHFASKDALIHALLEQRHDTLAGISGDTLEAFEQAIFDELIASTWQDGSGRLELEAIAASASDKELNLRVSANIARIQAQLARGLTELRDTGVVRLRSDPEEIAEMIHCFVFGKMVAQVVQPVPSAEASRGALHRLIGAFVVPAEG